MSINPKFGLNDVFNIMIFWNSYFKFQKDNKYKFVYDPNVIAKQHP